jgi:hypothetical protein
LISKGLSNLSHSLSLSVSSILSIAVVEHSEKDGIFMQNRIVLLNLIEGFNVFNIKVRNLSNETNPN